MIGFVLLVFAAAFLMAAHYVVRIGVPKGILTASDAFIFGHWPFLFLNGVLLWATPGRDWTLLSIYGDSLLPAFLIAVTGLTGFVVGSLFAVGFKRRKALHGLDPPAQESAEGFILLMVGGLLTVVGASAEVANYFVVTAASGRPSDSVNALLGLATLNVPGVVLLLCVFLKKTNYSIKVIAVSLAAAGLAAMLTDHSRRPLIVTLLACVALWNVRRRGYFSLNTFIRWLPIVVVLVVALLVWRVMVAQGLSYERVVGGGVVNYYADNLWLEASAFSGLMATVKEIGLTAFHGGESLISPLFFWLPRDLAPWKPQPFDMREVLGVQYTVGPSLYAEVMFNFTVFGVLPFCAVLGYLFKRVDVAFIGSSRKDLAYTALYALFVFNSIFIVRGVFFAMFMPVLSQSLIPLMLLVMLRRIGSGGSREIRANAS